MREEELENLEKTVFIQELLKNNGYRTMAVDWMERWFKRGYYTLFPKKDPSYNQADVVVKKATSLLSKNKKKFGNGSFSKILPRTAAENSKEKEMVIERLKALGYF